jgi:hypothetical protein
MTDTTVSLTDLDKADRIISKDRASSDVTASGPKELDVTPNNRREDEDVRPSWHRSEILFGEVEERWNITWSLPLDGGKDGHLFNVSLSDSFKIFSDNLGRNKSYQ